HFIIEDVVTPKNLSTVRRLNPVVRIWRVTAVRRLTVVLFVLAVWELAARQADAPLLLPSVFDTLGALKQSLASPGDSLWRYIGESLKMLLIGFAIGGFVAS